MDYCGECGGSLSADLAFCPLCGAQVERDDVAERGPLAAFSAPADWGLWRGVADD